MQKSISDYKLELEELLVLKLGLRWNSETERWDSKNGIDLSNYKIPEKRKLLRNCVHPPVGLHILESIL